MSITAKYSGRCAKCGGDIHPGDRIDYDPKTRKTCHVKCESRSETKQAQPAAPRKLTAQFASPCLICARQISPGDAILYQQGKGSWHAACDGKQPVPLNSRMPDQMLAADSDLAALAAQHGRTIQGEAEIHSLMLGSGAKVGEVVVIRLKRYLLLAVGPSRYYSADYLEDMDMFDMRPGRYADAQAVVVEPTEAEAAAAAEQARKKARAEEVSRALRASYGAEQNIGYSAPKDVQLTKIYGSSRMAGSETWYQGSDGAMYYCRSDYDMGPVWWRTTASIELVREAESLGVRP